MIAISGDPESRAVGLEPQGTDEQFHQRHAEDAGLCGLSEPERNPDRWESE